MSDKKNSTRNQSRAKAKKPLDTSYLQEFINSFGGTRPSIHVNGTSHPTAIITVDLGTPPVGQRIAPEQSQELITRLRRLTRDLYNRDDMNIRVSYDNNNGIFWSSVA